MIAKKAAGAIHVLDRFHIMAKMRKALDEVRAQESKALVAKGYEPVLKHTRWLLLKRPENLSEKQEPKLAELLQYNLRSVRAYLLKEDFQFFWSYVSPYWAGQFLDRWCTRTMRSQIKPMKTMARTLRAHRPLLLNWVQSQGDSLCRQRRGIQQQGETHPQKVLRVQDLQSHGNRFVSCTWRATRTKVYPQILLKSRSFYNCP